MYIYLLYIGDELEQLIKRNIELEGNKLTSLTQIQAQVVSTEEEVAALITRVSINKAKKDKIITVKIKKKEE